MRATRQMRTAIQVVAFAAALMSLAGCSTIEDFFSSSDSKPKLPGQRLSIMEAESKLEVDESKAAQPIVLPDPVTNTEWSQPGGNAQNAMSHLKVGGFERSWSSSAGSGSSRASSLLASPIIADGRIYVLDAKSTVRAFDERTGSRLWDADLVPDEEDSDEGFGGGISYSDHKLFVVNGFGDAHALDAATGKVIWTQKIGTPFRASPAADDGRVFAVTADNQLLCFSASTGEILWRQRGMVESAGILTATSPAVSGSIVIVPYSSGEIYAMRVDNGTIMWSDALTRAGKTTSLSEINDIAGRPVVDRDRVFAISHSGRMVAIDLRTGERVWTRNIAGVQTPWVAGDTIFLVTTDQQVVALSRDDGSIRWVRQLQQFEDDDPKDDRVQWSGPVLASNHLVLVSSLGDAVLISPQTGTVESTFDLPDHVLIPPVVANGTMYVLTDDADLVALR
jgi:outer membrane protein assembly factor BamB